MKRIKRRWQVKAFHMLVLLSFFNGCDTSYDHPEDKLLSGGRSAQAVRANQSDDAPQSANNVNRIQDSTRTGIGDIRNETQRPMEVLTMFFEALDKGDVERALFLTTGANSMPQSIRDSLSFWYQNRARDLQESELPIVIAEKVKNETAIVVFYQKPNGAHIDYDPAFLIRQVDQWRVMPRLTRYDRSHVTLSERQRSDFEELEEWFEREKRKQRGKFVEW